MEDCEKNFKKIYPKCVNSTDHGTVMYPPVFPFGYDAPTGQASGAKALTDLEKDTIRGDNAELKISHLLEKFGQNTEHEQPMFVLTQLKLSKSFKSVLQQVLPADHDSVSSENFKGEIDFVIIHRRIGVILMEVKSSDTFTKRLQREARKQLQKGEDIIHALLQTDHTTEISIPVHKVIALPNVTDECPGNLEFINLREDHVRSDSHFNNWWKSAFLEREFKPEEQQKLERVISICIGQKPKVSSAVLASVYKKIDRQNFLKNSYEKERKNPGDTCQKVSQPLDNLETKILAKQFSFLNPDQLRIWNGDSHMFFNGSSGSGKTILLQFKALKCAEAGEQKVVVVVPLPLIVKYKKFFDLNGISSETIDVLSPVEFFHGSFFTNNDVTSQFHFFADELQTFQTELPNLFTLLETLMAKFDASDCYCWMAYDYMQIIEDTISLDETGGIRSSANFQLNTQELCGKFLSFRHAPCLNTVVRSTLQIYDYLLLFMKKALKELFEKVMLLEHIDEETKQSWDRWVRCYEGSNHLGHRVCGPSVAVRTVTSLDDVVEIIATEISNWTTKDCLHRVAVLVTTKFPKENLSQRMKMKGIPFCDIGYQTNKVVLDYGHKAHSYEWPIVIAVSNCNDNSLSAKYIMLTRGVTRLVDVTSISAS